MNHRHRLEQIIEFLKPYQKIWQNEIMLQYPAPLKDYPLDWVSELAAFKNKSDVIRLEKKEITGLVTSQELTQFYQQIEELVSLATLPVYPPMAEDRWTFLHTIPKKQHEIRKLAPFVNQLVLDQKIGHVIDIGGGIGKLAQTLSNQYHLNMISVDMDPVMQETGKARHAKYFQDSDKKVKYVTAKVDRSDVTFRELLEADSLTLGLHTCGTLANHQIITSSQHKISAILNFGCCYHKLEHDPDGQNISQYTRSHPDKIELSHFALALSARAHRKMDEKDYDLKQKVKVFRYAIHFLLHDHYGHPELMTLGNSTPSLYDEDFATYALEQMQRVQIISTHSKEELNAYFNEPARQDMIWKMVTAGLIRNAFGRLLELYILLDRALYLEEQGYQVGLMRFFEEEVSPRNIGLVATL